MENKYKELVWERIRSVAIAAIKNDRSSEYRNGIIDIQAAIIDLNEEIDREYKVFIPVVIK